MWKIISILSVCILFSACASTGGGYGGRLSHNFPVERAATGKNVFIFDPQTRSWAAYDAAGQRKKVGRASGGRNYCPDTGGACRTVTGKFKVYSKKGFDCKSSKFPLPKGGALMPYCMHFHKGYAIHGAPTVPNSHVSHGCIRVSTGHARWLNHSFLKNGDSVVVKPY